MQSSPAVDGTRRPLSADALASVLEAVELLNALYPLPDELVVPRALVDRLQKIAADSSTADEPEDQLVLRLRLDLDEEHAAELEIAFPLTSDRAEVIGPGGSSREEGQASRAPPPTVTLTQPAWLQNAAFERLTSKLSLQTAPSTDDEPTTLVLDFVQQLQDAAPAFLPAASVASTRSSYDGPSVNGGTRAIRPGEVELTGDMTKELLICVSKMHRAPRPSSPPGVARSADIRALTSLATADIRSMSKFKKVKGFALDHGVSGLAKAGRPGLLLYEVEGRESLARFLEAVRGAAAFRPSPNPLTSADTAYPPRSQIPRVSSSRFGLA